MKNKTIEQVEFFDGMNNLAKTFGVVTNLKIHKGITKYAIKNNVENTLTVHNLYCRIIPYGKGIMTCNNTGTFEWSAYFLATFR